MQVIEKKEEAVIPTPDASMVAADYDTFYSTDHPAPGSSTDTFTSLYYPNSPLFILHFGYKSVITSLGALIDATVRGGEKKEGVCERENLSEW